MPSLGAGPLLPLGSVVIFLAGAKRHALRGASLPSAHHPATQLGVSGVVACGGLATAAPQALDIVNATGPMCGVAPPKQAGANSMVVPEKCIGASKKAKRRRRRGGGAGDGDGMDDGAGGRDGGGGEGGWGDGWGEDGREWGEGSTRLAMWAVLCVYSMAQSVYFVLFGNEEKAQGPLMAAITSSLCARVHAKCRRMVLKKI
ncbi:unnamed protein product [Ostreobium quekettii]|uniref:Uncharacterized protein n=1 Tax=Ostreobium quekettii TaxID=121088 RepID=A0A8S1J414_9CHLO|nr:unnamed protein product [Ostreobium quekettii]